MAEETAEMKDLLSPSARTALSTADILDDFRVEAKLTIAVGPSKWFGDIRLK